VESSRFYSNIVQRPTASDLLQRRFDFCVGREFREVAAKANGGTFHFFEDESSVLSRLSLNLKSGRRALIIPDARQTFFRFDLASPHN